MKDCRRVQRLIHLHREGERTQDEDRMVRDHVAICPACTEVLRSVEDAGAAIAALRNAAEAASAAPGLVGRTMDEIGKAGAARTGFVPPVLAGLRPAVAFALLCAMVLVAQQGRDAWESAKMERRLAGLAGPEQLTVTEKLSELAGALYPRSKGGRGAGISGAGAVPRFLLPGFSDEGLFRAYAKKYPSLASVNPYDGIDERERKILSTEGKAFLDEFTTVLRKGG